MRVRKIVDGLRQFGRGQGSFWVNVPDGPAQVAGTRLGLWLGQWWLNLPDGTPWETQVLGKYTGSTRDAAIQARILGTPGVTEILAYQSSLNTTTRQWNVQATIKTIYGAATIVGVM